MELLVWLVQQALRGQAVVLSYEAAHGLLWPEARRGAWGQAHAQQVTALAWRTPEMTLLGLQHVRLDSFIVNKTARLPGDGHWSADRYGEREWRTVPGSARLIAS